jgi:hypothetical protein
MSGLSCLLITVSGVFVGAALGFAYDLYFTDLSNMDNVNGTWRCIGQGAFFGGLIGLTSSALLTISI